jgi:hypothetical protein
LKRRKAGISVIEFLSAMIRSYPKPGSMNVSVVNELTIDEIN